MTTKQKKLLQNLETQGHGVSTKKNIATLNELVNLPNHNQHQVVVFEMQRLKDPSSVPYLRQALENGFEIYQYTCSEDSTIAKWFSHALRSIGTAEAIQVIKDFAASENEMIAKEMQYRLSTIK